MTVGRVGSSRTVAFASDPRVQAGVPLALLDARQSCMRTRWHCPTACRSLACGIQVARLSEGVASLTSVDSVFAAMTRASGVVPQISVVLGPPSAGRPTAPH